MVCATSQELNPLWDRELARSRTDLGSRSNQDICIKTKSYLHNFLKRETCVMEDPLPKLFLSKPNAVSENLLFVTNVEAKGFFIASILAFASLRALYSLLGMVTVSMTTL